MAIESRWCRREHAELGSGIGLLPSIAKRIAIQRYWRSTKDGENIRGLARIAEIHDARLSNLDDPDPKA